MQEVHRQREIYKLYSCAVMFAGQYPGYSAAAYGYSDPYGRPPTVFFTAAPS